MIVTQKQLERMGLDEEPKRKKGGRYTDSAYPGGGPVRFGAKRFRADDGLSTKPAPDGLKREPMPAEWIADARRRRRSP